MFVVSTSPTQQANVRLWCFCSAAAHRASTSDVTVALLSPPLHHFTSLFFLSCQSSALSQQHAAFRSWEYSNTLAINNEIHLKSLCI